MSDRGHELTDDILSKLEANIGREYAKATEDAAKKLEKYLEETEKGREIQKRLLDAGKITQKQYNDWVFRRTMIGKRWQAMRDMLAADMHKANTIASGMIKNTMPDVYALNMNYGTYDIEHGGKVDTGFTLYNHDTAEYLLSDERELMPGPSAKKAVQIAANKDMQWNKQHIQSAVLQGVLQGESPYTVAARLSQVGRMNYAASVRYARTMTTSAQNAGRYQAYRRADRLGVDLTIEWQATLDNRTRHDHRMMHGQRRNVDEPFITPDGFEILYPAEGGKSESDLPQRLIWNCRCTLLSWVKGFEGDTVKESPKMGDMTFEEWQQAKAPKQKEQKPATAQRDIGKPAGESRIAEAGNHTVVNGSDISATWTRRSDKFAFEIEDIINAQGFDGVPRIVSQEEFDAAVKAANGGNGFIAQRTYSAPDQETLDAYRDQLYHGKWYVDCSTGGAQYGQGMYCAADYSGALTDGIKNEMSHYVDINKAKGSAFNYVETMTLDPSAKIISFDEANRLLMEYQSGMFEKISGGEITMDYAKENTVRNVGAYAASLGYDAINAEGHGESGSYTVVLNRTKCIFLGG